MLCYAMLCYAMLCYTIPCYAIQFAAEVCRGIAPLVINRQLRGAGDLRKDVRNVSSHMRIYDPCLDMVGCSMAYHTHGLLFTSARGTSWSTLRTGSPIPGIASLLLSRLFEHTRDEAAPLKQHPWPPDHSWIPFGDHPLRLERCRED